MPTTVKRRALLFLLLAVLATALLAAALPQLELKTGIPLPAGEGGVGPAMEESPPGIAVSVSTLFKAILGILLLLAAAYCLVMLPRHVPWKEMLNPTLFVVVLLVALAAILLSLSNVRIVTAPQEPEILPPAIPQAGPPLGPLPSFLIWLVWAGLAALLVLLAAWLVAGRARRTGALAWEAERALRALRAGQDIRNVIVRCYLQMSLVLQKEQGIERAETMTAREFERLLEARGIPHDPVHQLTRLFETARYGFRPSTPDDEQAAVGCLQAIVKYSGQEGKKT